MTKTFVALVIALFAHEVYAQGLGTRYPIESESPTDATADELFGTPPEQPEMPPAASDPMQSQAEDAFGNPGQPAEDATPAEPSAPGVQPYTPMRQPPAQPPATDTKLSASDLLRSMLDAPTGATLDGKPTTLTEVVSSRLSRERSTDCIEAYWALSTAAADYYLALREQQELQVLHASVATPGPAWQTAAAALADRVRVAGLDFAAAQHRLLDLMEASQQTAELPLPVDVPHTGSYDTRFDEIFTDERAPKIAQVLDDLLPLQYAELRENARAVREAEQWLKVVSQNRAQQTDGAGLLKAHELLVLQRRAFLDSVFDYNAKIARYAELASPGTIAAKRLVAMLIRNPVSPPDEPLNDNNVRPSSAEEPAERPASDNDGWTQSRRPETPAVPDGVERSILRKPESN